MNREVAALFTDTSLFRDRLQETAKDADAMRKTLNDVRGEWTSDKRDEPAFSSLEYAIDNLEVLAVRLRRFAEEQA